MVTGSSPAPFAGRPWEALTTDDAYRRRSAQLLEGVEYAPKRVLTISDAEILALDDPQRPRVTPLLSTREMSEQDRVRLARRAARRLFEAGHTEDGTPLGGPDSDAPEPTAQTVLRLRRSWLCLLTIDRTTSGERDFVSVYLRADGRAMTETATENGLHRFTLMKRAITLDCVVGILAPRVDGADADGRTYPFATWQHEALTTLSRATVVSALICHRHDHAMERRTEDRFAVYSFDDRMEILFRETADRVRIAPISRKNLRRRLEEITRPIDAQEGSTT